MASYDGALALAPDHGEAPWNKALALLLGGEYRRGFALYESRWSNRRFKSAYKSRAFVQPLWLGQHDLDGKTILLHSEQGLGDSIQFCRYATLVAARGARVILQVPASLLRLLQGLPGVSAVLASGSPIPPFDFHCPLMSLPLACGTERDSIPAPLRYLSVSAAQIAHWSARS